MMLIELMKLIEKTTPSSICDITKPLGEIIKEENDTIYIWYKAMIFKGHYVNSGIDDKILDGVNKIVKSKSGKPSVQSITLKLEPDSQRYSSILNVLLQYKKDDLMTLDDQVQSKGFRTLLGLK